MKKQTKDNLIGLFYDLLAIAFLLSLYFIAIGGKFAFQIVMIFWVSLLLLISIVVLISLLLGKIKISKW